MVLMAEMKKSGKPGGWCRMRKEVILSLGLSEMRIVVPHFTYPSC